MCCAAYAATPLSTHSRKGPAKHSRIPASDTRNITTYAATAAMLAASTPPAEATMKYTHVTGKAMAACAKKLKAKRSAYFSRLCPAGVIRCSPAHSAIKNTQLPER